MITIFTQHAPELFDVDLGNGTRFHCSDAWVRKYLHEQLGWSLQACTCTPQKLPDNYEEILLEAYLREAWIMQNHQIPAELRVNTDQTQTVYQLGMKFSWNMTGEKQVNIVGKDDKRAFTLIPSISASSDILPMQAIYSGGTKASCPSSKADHYEEAQKLGFLLEPSCTDTSVLVYD